MMMLNWSDKDFNNNAEIIHSVTAAWNYIEHHSVPQMMMLNWSDEDC